MKRRHGWDSSDRSTRLPADWPARRSKVIERAAGVCEQTLPSGKRCGRKGVEVDHKVAGDNHALWNLQFLCKFHHDLKTQGEARAARQRYKPKRRPDEGHPSDF
jgi:5-methylcytosine-specific restriction protein A